MLQKEAEIRQACSQWGWICKQNHPVCASLLLGQNAPSIRLQDTTGNDPEENTKQASAY
jgi:hypothetical protein